MQKEDTMLDQLNEELLADPNTPMPQGYKSVRVGPSEFDPKVMLFFLFSFFFFLFHFSFFLNKQFTETKIIRLILRCGPFPKLSTARLESGSREPEGLLLFLFLFQPERKHIQLVSF